MIQFENVSKRFKNVTVLNNLSFEIEKGELVSIIGASGCGKTTLLKMINRLINPNSGKIYINGEDIHKKDVIKLRRTIGYVIQQTGLFPHMTVRENIEIIPKLQKRNSKEIAKNTLALMNMVGMDGEKFLDRYPTELSGGQQQRIGVARAFATEPQIILMDEPFSALDPITRTDLQDELVNLQANVKKTIVFVTHDMDEAIKISDKICIMDGGKIIQYDTPENILKNPANEFVSNFVGKNRIWTSPELIKVSDIMIDNPVSCSKEFPVLKCMEKMRSHQVDSLMIVEPQTKLFQGIVTAKTVRNADDKSVPVSQIMSTTYFELSPNQTIIDALKTINENKISKAPVLNEQGTLVGLVTKSSLVTTLSQQYIEMGDE